MLKAQSGRSKASSVPSSCSSLPPSPSPTVMPTSNRQSRQPASSTDLTLRCHSRLTRGCHSWHICCDWNGKASKGHQSSAFLKPCLLDLKSRHPTHSHQPRTRGVCVAGPAPTHNKFNQRVSACTLITPPGPSHGLRGETHSALSFGCPGLGSIACRTVHPTI